MNILWIIHNQAGTGPYFKVVELCAALGKAGANVTLMCTHRSRHALIVERVEQGIHIIEFPDLLVGKLRQGPDPYNTLRRILWGFGKKFDIIHAVDSRPNVILPALALRMLTGAKLVQAWWDLFGSGGMASERSGVLYNSTFGKIESWFENAFRLKPDGATPVTHFLRDRLIKMGFPAHRAIVSRVGCETKVPKFDKESARKKLGLSLSDKLMCFVGTMYKTDFDVLLHALDIVRLQEQYKLIWIGSFDIPEEICQKYHIIHTGRLARTEDVFAYLSAVDICLLPMKQNVTNIARWPSKVMDYMSASRPIITAPVSDFPILFAQNDIGWLAKSDSPEDFSSAILQALREPERWDAKGARARIVAKEQFDVRVIAQQLLDFYRTLR